MGVGTDEGERINPPEREVKELRRANEMLKVAKLFSPKRSSTADSNSEIFRRAASRQLWDRVSLQGYMDRPLRLPAPHSSAGHPTCRLTLHFSKKKSCIFATP